MVKRVVLVLFLTQLLNEACIILQCDPEEAGACDSGCNGGLMNSAFEYTLKAGGLMKEKDYPYTGTDRGTCKFDKSKIAAAVSNFSVVSLDEDQIAANLVKNGPLAGEQLCCSIDILPQEHILLVSFAIVDYN